MRGETESSATGGEAAPVDTTHQEGAIVVELRQREAPDRREPIEALTDIQAVQKFCDRLSLETGATVRSTSLRKIVVETAAGKYRRELGAVRFDSDGEAASSHDDYAPTAAEAEAIKAEWKLVEWPEYRPCLFTGRHEPRNDPSFPWSNADPANVFVCWDAARQNILCVEERRYLPDGGKIVLIWSYFSDCRWRLAEPPESLPLFGLETVGNASTIFVHEGPKAARAIQRLIDEDGDWQVHPWGAALRGPITGAVAHVGWLGGAERPEATDWKPLAQCGARIIFVADNDRPGMDAICRISRNSGLKMEALCFTDEWPHRFDLADPFPADRIQAGTELSDLLTPATWATDVIQTGRRPSFEMRRAAIAEWHCTISPPLFFHAAYPGRGFSEAEVDAMMRPFSDAELTARLIRKNFSSRADSVAYLPGSKPVIERGAQRLVNLWTPCKLKERAGSVWPLGRLLVSQFPDRADRKHTARWGATLSARPEVRMEYAPLLQSETQGTGKTTLANIAAALVGPENVSRPNEAALTEGNFNSHLAKKRLVIVDEIYSGHSRKTYNRLKAPITDTRLRVNEKYQPEYEIDNFAHFIFNSNDLIAMLIDSTDRRFFIPRMSEKKLPPSFWIAFHGWLADGGLGIIKRCAREFVERHGAVRPGQAAPMTAAKSAMIDNSVSDEMRSVRDAAREMVERGAGNNGQRIAVTLEDFQAWHCSLCRVRGWRRLTGNRLADELRRAKMFIRGRNDKLGLDQRVKIGGRKVPVASNFDADAGEDAADAADAIRSALKSMGDLGFGGPPM